MPMVWCQICRRYISKPLIHERRGCGYYLRRRIEDRAAAS